MTNKPDPVHKHKWETHSVTSVPGGNVYTETWESCAICGIDKSSQQANRVVRKQSSSAPKAYMCCGLAMASCGMEHDPDCFTRVKS